VKVSPVRGGEFLASPSLLFLPPPYYSPTPNTIFRQKGPTNAAHNSNQSQKLWVSRGGKWANDRHVWQPGVKGHVV